MSIGVSPPSGKSLWFISIFISIVAPLVVTSVVVIALLSIVPTFSMSIVVSGLVFLIVESRPAC
jgi:hypothetical protein